ncbi:MAG: exodeoxyribonuclease VII large subunit, partial [Clostridia bacterium]|nr:exodeoxyribonuclease VII large subunit [Clostridia bacterium]
MRLQSLLGGRLSQERRMLEALANAAVLRRPEQLLDRFRMQLADREERMERGAALLLERRRTALARAAGRLQALSPLSVLARGYAAVEQEGRTCSSASALLPGDRFTVRFSDGLVRAVAEGVELFEREEKEKD